MNSLIVDLFIVYESDDYVKNILNHLDSCGITGQGVTYEHTVDKWSGEHKIELDEYHYYIVLHKYVEGKMDFCRGYRAFDIRIEDSLKEIIPKEVVYRILMPMKYDKPSFMTGSNSIDIYDLKL